jgi:hypothetical protein
VSITLESRVSAEPNIAPAVKRWLRMGPWYAMFPMKFALEVIKEHTEVGDSVLDPFMGRGTTVSAAAALGRNAAGMEIHPIAWLYARAKVAPAEQKRVLAKLGEIEELAHVTAVPELPEFFSWAFCEEVLKFLVAARLHLDWKNRKVDRTLMALILVDLHGKEKDSLSNQMRQTKSLSPQYAVRWWKKQGMIPRQKDPAVILQNKIRWRYWHGLPFHSARALAVLGDSTRDLHRVKPLGPFKFLLTSPPYYGVINYNYDQWIRRWMLGGPDKPTYSSGQWQDRFENQGNYRCLLKRVFSKAAKLLAPDAKLLVRTDAREFTLTANLEILQSVFPNKTMTMLARPFDNKTQTHLFGDKTDKPGEIDILMTP